LTQFDFVSNWTKVTDTLHEDLCTFTMSCHYSIL